MSSRVQWWIGEGSWKRKLCARDERAISVLVCWTLQLIGSSPSAAVWEVKTTLPVLARPKEPLGPARPQRSVLESRRIAAGDAQAGRWCLNR